ncbi:MAG: 3'-5' exonuclease [Actinobacteria bacterium]|jgi:DNA polymerase III epsilon subunit-like protein|nr:3'-5' exonuclease [Actinomycetota bacterium]
MNSEPSKEQKVLDRRKAILWSRRLLDDLDSWCIIDTETTGLNPKISRVVEITVLGGNGEVRFGTYVNPGCEIPSEASRIHGITKEKLIDAPLIADVWTDLMDVTKGKLLIAYNSAYDRAILDNEAIRNGLQIISERWECAMIQYSSYVGSWNSRFGNYTYQKLPSAGHRSYLDCKVTLDLIRSMADSEI